MNFYYFGLVDDLDALIENKFDGILFTYNAIQSDYFTYSARHLNKDQDFKYMVALRPYAMSPQYLAMMFRSFNGIKPNSLQVNLIAGYIKEEEKGYGGIIGDVNDYSSKVDKSNYLIKYINVLNDLNKKEKDWQSGNLIDFYVSTTNKFVFSQAADNQNKMIIAYSGYTSALFEINGSDHIMISMGPIIRDTQEELDAIDKDDRSLRTNDTVYFTKDDFMQELDNLKNRGIKDILLFAWPVEEKERLFSLVKEYKDTRMEISEWKIYCFQH